MDSLVLSIFFKELEMMGINFPGKDVVKDGDEPVVTQKIRNITRIVAERGFRKKKSP